MHLGICALHVTVCVCYVIHRSAIFSLLLVTDNIIATGDDEGSMKVADVGPVFPQQINLPLI